MENQNQKVSQNDNQPKNKKIALNKHLMIALSILGAAVLIALIITIVAVVYNANNRVNGKDPTQLYSDLEISVLGQNNYHYVIEEVGNGLLYAETGDVAVKTDIKTREEVKVDGDNFYYQHSLTQNGQTTTITVTIIDGKGYICNENPGMSPEKSSFNAKNDDFKNSLISIKSLIWDYEDLFDKSTVFKKENGFRLEMDKSALKDTLFVLALRDNAEDFFEDNGGQNGSIINQCTKNFKNCNYAVVYDGTGRPAALSYSYTMFADKLFDGNLSVNATFDYGTSVIELPEGAEDYN